MPQDSMLPSQQLMDELQSFYKVPRKRLDEAIQEIFKKVYPDPSSEIYSVQQPSGFQKDVPVIGSPEFARDARKLIDLSPNIKEQLGSVMMGPTSGSMNEMTRSKLPIDAFENTDLLGVYKYPEMGKNNTYTKSNIGINPGLEDRDALAVLAHELAHAAGYRNDYDAEIARNVFKMGDKPNPASGPRSKK
jgi:hypothetical protein